MITLHFYSKLTTKNNLNLIVYMTLHRQCDVSFHAFRNANMYM